MKIISLLLTITLLLFIGQACEAQAANAGRRSTTNNRAMSSTSVQSNTNATGVECPNELPAILFEKNKVTLTATAKELLKQIASTIKQLPGTLLFVNGVSLSTKSGQNSCNRKLNTVKNYLSEVQGIRVNRIIINCDFTDVESEANLVSFTCEKE